MKFIFTRELGRPKPIQVDAEVGQDRTDVPLTQHQLVQVWIFGDKRGVPALQNKTIDLLHRSVLQAWSWDSQANNILIYNETVAQSKLRQFIVEHYSRVGDLTTMIADDLYTEGFLCDIIRRMHALRKEQNNHQYKQLWRDLDLCRFHVHYGMDCKGQEIEARGDGTDVVVLTD